MRESRILRRPSIALVVLAACRINFDPAGATSDASDATGAGPDSAAADASLDAMSLPVIQAVSLDTPTAAGLTIDGNRGLAPVTPGNMVLVTCGGLNLPSPCAPVSTPSATWLQIDGGTTLGVYVACNAPAITSITVTNGGTELQLVVTEWSGVAAMANCYDTSRISTACAAAPTAWNTLPTNQVVSQNRELIVALGTAGAADAGWTVDAPYTMAKNATGVNGASNVFLAYQEVDASPTTYAATGTIDQYSTACFTDVFAFRAP